MSNSVVSKNLYELLGNDPELDPNREPAPPTKVVDKPLARPGKRNGGADAPVRDAAPAAAARGGRKEAFTGSEQAIRDKNAGSSNNRTKPTDDGLRRDRHPRETGERSRGGRGGRGGNRGPRGDRHDRSGVAHSGEKQAAHGWGAETGTAELSDEKAGLADAHSEEKEGGVVANSTAPVEAEVEAEPEDNTKSYEQYLAEQLEKKAALNAGPLEPRKANEGSSKKFPEGKAFARSEADEAFIAASAGKNKRERERKEKNVVDIDLSWKEEQAGGNNRDSAPRGGRGGRGRGGPRGGDRGARRGGDRPERTERTERSERTERAPRGGAPRTGATPNVTSAQDFPSLS